jgi:hypothetical protein
MIFEGTWTVCIATPIGKQSVVLEIFNQEGAIKGLAKQGTEVVEFISPALKDNHLTWTQQITKPLRLTIKFDVTSEENTMQGTAKAGYFPASALTGERLK